MIQRLLYVLYAIEFLIALIAIFTVWSQVGGQGHLDLLPWYVKLSTAMALAWSTVRFTSADVVRHPLVGRIVEAYEGPGR